MSLILNRSRIDVFLRHDSYEEVNAKTQTDKVGLSIGIEGATSEGVYDKVEIALVSQLQSR